MSTIDKSSYPTLFGPTANYAVLANFLSMGGSASTTIINGNYGLNLSPVGGTGTQDNFNAPAGFTELNTLLTSIYALTPTLIISGSNPTFNGYDFSPGVYRFETTGGTNGAEFTGILNFDAGGDATAQFIVLVPFLSNYVIRFFNTVTINLIDGAQASNIFWVSYRTEYRHSGTLYGVFASNNISAQQNVPVTVNGNLLIEDTLQVVSNALIVDAPAALCLLKGTKLLTHRGEVAIEDITENDQLVTYGKIHQHKDAVLEEPTLEPVVWCGHFSVADLNTMTYPICFKAHSLGENLPSEDLYVSPGHGLMVDNVLTFAHTFINGTTIFQDKSFTAIEYYHIKVDGHRVIRANGVWTESLNYDMKKIERRPDLYTKNEVTNQKSICMTA
jgi:hypothetical protein